MPRRIRPLLSSIEESSPNAGWGKLAILDQPVPELKLFGPENISPVFVSPPLESLPPTLLYSPPSRKILSLGKTLVAKYRRLKFDV